MSNDDFSTDLIIQPLHFNSSDVCRIDLTKIQCEIKLVNNFKKLQLRASIAFECIDPSEIRAMLIAYYKIHCALPTILQFDAHCQPFDDIPSVEQMTGFLHDSDVDLHDDDVDRLLLSMSIELPILVVPITKASDGGEYLFYAFQNGTLVLSHNGSELKRTEAPKRSNCSHHICFKDVIAMFDDIHGDDDDGDDEDNWSLLNPKNLNFVLNIYEKINSKSVQDLNANLVLVRQSQQEMRCMICLDDISLGSEEYCRISCCPHLYHYQCVQQLIRYSHDKQCPLCRAEMTYVQCLFGHNHTIHKIFKIRHTDLFHISHRHYLNKYYVTKPKHVITQQRRDAVAVTAATAAVPFDDEKEGQIIDDDDAVPNKPCLGYFDSIPSPTNSNSSISIPPTRQSSPSLSEELHVTATAHTNNNNGNNNNNNNIFDCADLQKPFGEDKDKDGDDCC